MSLIGFRLNTTDLEVIKIWSMLLAGEKWIVIMSSSSLVGPYILRLLI